MKDIKRVSKWRINGAKKKIFRICEDLNMTRSLDAISPLLPEKT